MCRKTFTYRYIIYSITLFLSSLLFAQRAFEISKTPPTPSLLGYVRVAETSINTPYNESSPLFWGKQLVYLSDKKQAKKVNTKIDNELYKAEFTKYIKLLVHPSYFNKSIKGGKKTGRFTFTGDASAIVFTESKSEKDEQSRFQENNRLFVSEYNYFIKEWSKPTSFLNDSIIHINHPALSTDGRSLYFSSNYPYEGHIGGYDLYVIQQDAHGVWSQPINMGQEINTQEDEGFPYYHQSKRLFFSSNGHRGLGGLDIFYAKSTKGKIAINHLEQPFNSSADDFGISIDRKIKTAYFTSNREGGKGLDDIYVAEISLPDLVLSGQVTDQNTGKPISKALIILTDSINKKIDSTRTNLEGYYSLKIKHERDYKLSIKHTGFHPSKTSHIRENWLSETTSIQDKKLSPLPVLVDTVSQRVSFPVNFSFNSYVIEESENKNLAKLISILQRDRAIAVSIYSHTDCRGEEEYNLFLSQKRAQATVEYLVRNGVKRKQVVSAEGRGELEPIANCNCGDCSEVQYKANRRSEFELVKVVQKRRYK
ncbi:MAG: OmpA family protein [Cyclobacteriaceae bacterium]